MTSLLVILLGAVVINSLLLRTQAGAPSTPPIIVRAMRVAWASGSTLVLATAGTVGVISIAGATLTLDRTSRDTTVLCYTLATVLAATVLAGLPPSRARRVQRAIATSPLLTVSNSLALGTVLFGLELRVGALTVIAVALGTALAFAGLLLAFVSLSERITVPQVPHAFRRAPLALINAGLIALALMGFSGLLRI